MKFIQLGTLVKITSGFAFKSNLFNTEQQGLPLIRIRDVIRGFSETYYDGDYKGEYLIKNGDALIGMDGEFNIALWSGGRALLNQRVCKIQSINQDLDQKYLIKFLPKVLKDIEDKTPFVTVKHLSVKDIQNIQIPLLPLEEQRRIAEILDKADSLIQKRKEAIAKLDELLQATFIDMFGDVIENDKKLTVVPLSNLCQKITDGTHQSPLWAISGIPFLFISNIVNGEIDYSSQKFIDQDTYDRLTKNTKIELNDILYTTVGSYGNTARVKSDQLFCFQRHIAHIKPDSTKVKPQFLEQMLSTNSTKKQADRLVRGVAQKTLNLKDLKEIQVFDISLSQQNDFLKICDIADELKKGQHAQLETQETLFKALQQQAFSGQL